MLWYGTLASELAILRFMESVSSPVTTYRENHPKRAEKPFSSVFKYQFSIHSNNDPNEQDDQPFLVMKGAPERIIKLCKLILNGKDDERGFCLLTLLLNHAEHGETVPLTQDHLDLFEDAYRDLGSMGERVLAFCDAQLSNDQYPLGYQFNLEDEDNFCIEHQPLRFLGLVAMIDPPR